MEDSEIIKRPFNDPDLPEFLTYGFDEGSYNYRKTLAVVVFHGDVPVYRSSAYAVVDEAEPPVKGAKESAAAFAERVRLADEARASLNTYTETYPTALMEEAQRAAHHYLVQWNAQQDAARLEQERKLQQLERDEADYQIYLAYQRGAEIARLRGLI